MDEKYKRAYINELQFLQREINFLQKGAQSLPSLEKTIDTLRNSQTQLYEALTQHSVTAEEVHKIIAENADKQLISKIMKLQGMKDRLNKHLADPTLTPEKRHSLERSLSRTTQSHRDKWDEIINSPNKNDLIRKLEQAQIKQLDRQNRTRDRTHDHDRTR